MTQREGHVFGEGGSARLIDHHHLPSAVTRVKMRRCEVTDSEPTRTERNAYIHSLAFFPLECVCISLVGKGLLFAWRNWEGREARFE